MHLVVVDTRAPGVPPEGSATIRWFEDLLRLAGPTPVVVWAPEVWLRHRRVLELGRAGVREVIRQGSEAHPEVVSGLLAKLVMGRRFEALVRALPLTVPVAIASYLGALTILPDEWIPPTPDQMGKALGCERTTVFRRFAAAGLPPPRRMFGWIRVYLVSCLVEEGELLERAAMRVGFGSLWNFRRMVEDRTGIAVTDRESVLAFGSRRVLESLSTALSSEVA